MWCFNRLRDNANIETEELIWQGPFSWPGFEINNELKPIPNIKGVYLFSFDFKEGYLLYAEGITNSTKRRISTHTREFRKGHYNVLDINSAKNGERKEIWHGWQYAKSHPDEFIQNKETILKAVDNQLQSFRIFIAEISDTRKSERIEAAIMQNIYTSQEHWSELADRGMFLKGRYNSEIPIKIKNLSSGKIYGLPVILEI